MPFHPLDYSREAKRLALLADLATTPSVRSALRDRAGDFKVLAEGGVLRPGRMRDLELPDAVLSPVTDGSSACSSDWADS
jgi:hypothetical protein